MFLKQPRASTDPRTRSLLQKAVRRGYPGVVAQAVTRLDDAGDRTWLRSRAVVITFEECWPLAATLALTRDTDSKRAALIAVACSAKNKDAAGLGALAYAFHEGDESMRDVVPDRRAMGIVAEALDRPVDFFRWATSHALSGPAAMIVAAAHRYLAAATWGWDKACILAGAYLAATRPVPSSAPGPTFGGEFPFWAALDKHTPEGKELLHRISNETDVPYRQLIWAGFYFESAVANAEVRSPWWTAEMTWRLRGAGLDGDRARDLWERVRPRVKELSRPSADALQVLIESAAAPRQERLL